MNAADMVPHRRRPLCVPRHETMRDWESGDYIRRPSPVGPTRVGPPRHQWGRTAIGPGNLPTMGDMIQRRLAGMIPGRCYHGADDRGPDACLLPIRLPRPGRRRTTLPVRSDLRHHPAMGTAATGARPGPAATGRGGHN